MLRWLTPRTWGAVLIGILLVVAGLFLARPPDLERRSQQVETEVARQLARAGVRRARLLRESRTLVRLRGRAYHVVETVYQCPSRFSAEAFEPGLLKALKPLGIELLRAEHRQSSEARLTVLEFGYRGRRLYQLTLQELLVLPVEKHGKIAIVLDDWGYSRQLLPAVLQLNRPVTLSVLPHRRYSREIAEAVQGSLCEVILHMPMEPHDPNSPREPQVLSPGMTAPAVHRMLDEALATVPQARGVNNHQGSLATEDAALMRLVLNDLRQRHLLFLDSMVTDHSVCAAVAHELHLPFAQRSVFLDNEATPQAVRRQLLELAALARRAGHAVGIGHDKRVTVAVLREMMPQLEQQGIEFVHLSDVVQVP